mmetsp:Transcript_2727/g.4640  ORF Transcript_2727/g.4640 Transcript_2727/m.4640 type:complete len:103 (+) Transcript_2727:204-512(+)
MRHYVNNGGGRDSYIYMDNGGFTEKQKVVKWPEVGSIQQKPILQRPKPNPVMEAKTIFYRSDGTGRDQYINTTSGGQFGSTRSNFDYRDQFKHSLRDYKPAY